VQIGQIGSNERAENSTHVREREKHPDATGALLQNCDGDLQEDGALAATFHARRHASAAVDKAQRSRRAPGIRRKGSPGSEYFACFIVFPAAKSGSSMTQLNNVTLLVGHENHDIFAE
jgi:hypothetical protein